MTVFAANAATKNPTPTSAPSTSPSASVDAPSDRARTASVHALTNAARTPITNSGPGRIGSFGRPMSAIQRAPNTRGRKKTKPNTITAIVAATTAT
jgi:hypothetical protein